MKAILRVVPLLVAGSVLAQGSFDFEAITGYGQFSNGARDVTVGWSFRVHSQIKVTALGCFSDIIAGVPVTIGLWSSSQALLSSTSIAAAGAQAVTYSSIAPVMLDAGQTYFIGAFRPGFIAFRITGPGFGDLATLSSYLDTNYVAYAESASQQFAFPGRQGGQGVVPIAGTFGFVPEPSTTALMAAAGAAAIFALRRGRAVG